MSDKVLTGDDKLMAALNAIVDKFGGGSLEVGFREGATYEDGTSVASVAFWNEFGKNVRSKEGDYYQLGRPFFRRMIAAESPTWAEKMAKLAKGFNYDGERVLSVLGEDIRGALQQSINDLVNPPLADSTIERKGFSKPLIDTSRMINSITAKVNS